MGKVTTGVKGQPGLLDAQGRPVDLRRSHILSMCGPDGTPLDPNMPVTVGVGGERRETTLGAVAEQYFKISRTEQQARRLLPKASAEYYAATEAKHFPGGDPSKLTGSVFLGVSSIREVLDLIDPEHLAHGDDREEIKDIMFNEGVSSDVIDATLRDDCRYLLVACPGAENVVRLDDVSESGEIRWEQTKPGAPASLVLRDDEWEHTVACVGLATVIIGPAQEFEGEQLWTLHPGTPIPSDASIEEELTQLGYRHGDAIPYQVLRQLGIAYVQDGMTQTQLPRVPDAPTLPERVHQAVRYDAWMSEAERDCSFRGVGRVEITTATTAVFNPLRSYDEADSRPIPERLAWMMYGEASDVREAVAPDGSRCWELDGVQLRHTEAGLEAWGAELRDPESIEAGSIAPSWDAAGWVSIETVADLEQLEDLHARYENRRHGRRRVAQYELRGGVPAPPVAGPARVVEYTLGPPVAGGPPPPPPAQAPSPAAPSSQAASGDAPAPADLSAPDPPRTKPRLWG